MSRATDSGRVEVEPWDLLVVGGGTAGIVAAKTAARLGARAVLAEEHRTGGDCLWTGCVPSKSLLAAADVAAAARGGGRFGIDVGEVRVDLARVMDHVQSAIRHIEPHDSPASIEEVGASVLEGRVRLTGPTSAEVRHPDGTSTPLRFRHAVLATGAAPAIPSIPGIEDVDVLTSDTVWDLRADPGRLVVLGGGAIGCELGQGFARLGVDVTVVEGADRLLPAEDPAAAAAVTRALVADGVDVRTGAAVERVRPAHGSGAGPGPGVLLLEGGAEVPFDRLLVAIGRRPRTDDLGLDAAGVQVDDRGYVRVDDRLTTTNPRIRAAGDLTGHAQLTHVAGSHGSLAASNAVLGLRRRVDPVVPRVTYTQPEVAAVGVGTPGERDDIRVVRLPHLDVDRAVAEGRTDGFTALALDGKGRLVGATVVAPRAGEMLAELTAAIRRGDRPRDLGGVIHPYPAWSDGPWNAALVEVRAELEKPLPQRATRALVRTRRWWSDRRA